jgi:hypothetical protein
MKLEESKKQGPDWPKPDGTTNVSILEVIPSNASATSIQPNRIEQDHRPKKPRWERIRQAIRQPLAEFFGVFTLIIFGDGVVAQVVLSNGQKGDYQSINWGYIPLILKLIFQKVGDLASCWEFMSLGSVGDISILL